MLQKSVLVLGILILDLWEKIISSSVQTKKEKLEMLEERSEYWRYVFGVALTLGSSAGEDTPLPCFPFEMSEKKRGLLEAAEKVTDY